MNNNYYKNPDENFKEAINLIEKSLSHTELIKLLQTGNIPQKQVAALRLEYLTSAGDAEILISNLTGQDGKIREAVSLKIKELAEEASLRQYFFNINNEVLSEKFIEALTDINGNICRNIIDTLPYFESNEIFVNNFIEKLISLIFKLLDKIKDFDLQDGKYKINKEVFKLYWCLEACFVYVDKIPLKNLKKILNITKQIEDYTIREKTAKILSVSPGDAELLKIRNELKQDKNYYVRRF